MLPPLKDLKRKFMAAARTYRDREYALSKTKGIASRPPQ